MNDYIHRISDSEFRRIQRFLYLLAAGVVGFAILSIVTIATADTWLRLLSVEREQRFVQPYIDLVNDRFLDPADPDIQAYVEELALEIRSHMTDVPGLTISIRVIEDDTVNAFTTLGGHIYVADGLLEALHSENSLSMVLAHEIAHAINRDPLLSTGRGLLLAMALASLSGGTVDASAAGDVASQLMLNSFDREQEQRADLMALAALHSRYGHVGGATDLFRVLSDMQDGEPAALEGLEMLSTHPDLARRIEYLQADAASRDWTELSVMPYPDRVAEKIRTP